jgi:hypothetical protein
MEKGVQIYRRETVGSKGDSQEMTHRDYAVDSFTQIQLICRFN